MTCCCEGRVVEWEKNVWQDFVIETRRAKFSLLFKHVQKVSSCSFRQFVLMQSCTFVLFQKWKGTWQHCTMSQMVHGHVWEGNGYTIFPIVSEMLFPLSLLLNHLLSSALTGRIWWHVICERVSSLSQSLRADSNLRANLFSFVSLLYE